MQFLLPQVTLKAQHSAPDQEGQAAGSQQDAYDEFWLITDIFNFDNVGVSHEVVRDGVSVKYLTCADCEMGPIGFYSIDKTNEIFLCVSDRVSYD